MGDSVLRRTATPAATDEDDCREISPADELLMLQVRVEELRLWSSDCIHAIREIYAVAGEFADVNAICNRILEDRRAR